MNAIAMSRSERRAMAKAMKAARRPVRKPKANSDNIPLRACPWKIRDVFDPIEKVLDGIARHGTVEEARGRVVFSVPEEGRFELVPAIEGLVDFHLIAAKNHGVTLHLGPLSRFAKSLEVGKPVTMLELRNARAAIDEMKLFALRHLTVGEAKSTLTTFRIQMELERLEKAA